MDKMTFDPKETAEILGIPVSAVYKLREDGKIKKLPDLPGIKFRRKDVFALAGLKEKEYSPFEFQKLKAENENLQNQLTKLRGIMRSLNITLLTALGEEEKEWIEQKSY